MSTIDVSSNRGPRLIELYIVMNKKLLRIAENEGRKFRALT